MRGRYRMVWKDHYGKIYSFAGIRWDERKQWIRWLNNQDFQLLEWERL